MGLPGILQVGTKVLGRGTLLFQKHAPEILTVAGVVGVVTSAVLASRATLKLEARLEDGRERLERARYNQEHGDERAVVKAYARNSFEIVKLYAPSATLGVVSIVSIIGAHGLLRKRLVALTAAYKSLETAYSSYRERVAEKYGEDAERAIYHNLEETEVVGEDGKKTKSYVANDDTIGSQYAQWFDKSNVNFSPIRSNNLAFLQLAQNYFNHRLHAYGHVVLNEVYDQLGFDRTKEGAIIGWTDDGTGDDYIDFGINNLIARGDGVEHAILVDFNVEGIMWDKITNPRSK